MANSVTSFIVNVDSNFGHTQNVSIGDIKAKNASGAYVSLAGSAVTASSTYPGYTAASVIDGSTAESNTWYSADGTVIANQWVNIALPSALDISTVEIWNTDTGLAGLNLRTGAIVATHTGGGTTSVSFTRPSDAATASTSHTIPPITHQGVFSATSPTVQIIASDVARIPGDLLASAPSCSLVATGTMDNTIINIFDSASSQDTLVTSVIGTYNHLDSHETEDAPTVSAVSTYDLLDAHITQDGIAIVLEMAILDAATHQTILTREVNITAEVMESSRSEDGFTAWRVVEVEVFDAANNVDGVAVVWEVDLLDAVQHADLLSVTVDSTADVLDVAQALSEALGNALVELVLLDQSTTQELFQYEAIRNAEILDSALAQTMLGTDGDKAFYTYALNTLLNAGSRYGNHNFNSYAATDTACYAAGEGGVFLLSGDNDNGYTIPAGFRTNITDLRTEDAPEGARPRSVQHAYLGMTSSGELRLKASAANGGVADTRTYRVRQTGDTFDNTTRVVMGKGVQARYWQFTLENVHGEAFDIDQIELLPVARTRRI